MTSVATLFTHHAGIMNVPHFLLFISLVLELLHQQVHFSRQHVYLLELMHTSTSLAGLKNFLFQPWLEAIFSTRDVACAIVSDKNTPQQWHPYSHGCCLSTHGRKSTWVANPPSHASRTDSSCCYWKLEIILPHRAFVLPVGKNFARKAVKQFFHIVFLSLLV